MENQRMATSARQQAIRRLTPEDWIHAGIEGLLKHGVKGLRIACLAHELGVTPGSFYWHFRDRDQFRDQLLEFWIKQMIARVAAVVEQTGEGTEPIRALPDILVARGLPDYDTAMRKWALTDPVVAAAVAKADKMRLRRLTGFLEKAGFRKDHAALRAQTLYWVYLGSAGSDPALRSRTFKELIKTYLAEDSLRAGQAKSTSGNSSN
jgi:AcrR family transcriptional regulator